MDKIKARKKEVMIYGFQENIVDYLHNAHFSIAEIDEAYSKAKESVVNQIKDDNKRVGIDVANLLRNISADLQSKCEDNEILRVEEEYFDGKIGEFE